MSSLLEVTNATLLYGARPVVDAVSLDVNVGEAVGLIGANGAGKTSLFKMIAGEVPMSNGTVIFDGRQLTGGHWSLAHPGRTWTYPDARARRGLARTFQLVEMFGGLSVLDHVLVALQAHHGRQGPVRDLFGRGQATSDELDQCLSTLSRCGLFGLEDLPVEALSLGQRRKLELARALVGQPKLLLADEPSSGLDRSEANELADVIGRVRADSGLAVLVVEHDLATVEAIAQRVVAMEAGRVIASGRFADVVADPQVIASWLGKSA
jgi:branched-chain amino acid transport system ATP-binding protein